MTDQTTDNSEPKEPVQQEPSLYPDPIEPQKPFPDPTEPVIIQESWQPRREDKDLDE